MNMALHSSCQKQSLISLKRELVIHRYACLAFSMVAIPVYSSCNSVVELQCSTPLSTIGYFQSLILAILLWAYQYYIVILICTFCLMMLSVSICILPTQISVYLKCLSVFLNLNWDVSPRIDLQQFFLCMLHTYAIYMYCNYLLPICGLLFHSLTIIF